MIKYLILDFGMVLAYPPTGNWHITNKFNELIDKSKMDKEKFKRAYEKHKHILSETVITLDEEYDMMRRFYNNIFKDAEYSDYNEKICDEIAYDRVYGNDKYVPYDNIKAELKPLKNKYTLLLLSDNWPSVYNAMKEYGIYDYFDKIYVSSVYGQEKKDGDFFNNPINDYEIKSGEALFIDDKETLLDVAVSKGLDVKLMDRANGVTDSKYEIIHDLKML